MVVFKLFIQERLYPINNSTHTVSVFISHCFITDDFSLTLDASCDIAYLKKEIKTALGLNVDKDQIQFFHYEDNLDMHDEKTMLKEILDINDPTISIEWQSPQEAQCDVEERGKLSDTFRKPPKVIILSDIEREIIVPKLGRDPHTFFDKCQIDNRELPFQLSSSVILFELSTAAGKPVYK